MMADSADKERFRKLLEDIDPTIRLERLRDEKKQLDQRYMVAFSEASIQDRLVEKKKASIAAAGGDDKVSEAKLAELETSEDIAEQRWQVVEVIAEEIDRVREDLKKANEIGTRAERRRRSPRP